MGLLFPGATHSIPKPTFFYAKSLRTLPRPYWKTSIQLYTSTQLKIQSSQNHLGNSKLIQKNAILLYLLTLIGITLNQTHLKSACQSNHYALILGYQIREVSFFFLFFFAKWPILPNVQCLGYSGTRIRKLCYLKNLQQRT